MGGTMDMILWFGSKVTVVCTIDTILWLEDKLKFKKFSGLIFVQDVDWKY